MPNQKTKSESSPTRAIMIQVPIGISNALDQMKLDRQLLDGRAVTKRDLIVEALEAFVSTESA